MLSVNRVEKATKMRFSLVPNRDSFNWPVSRRIEHPMKVDPVWRTVRSHGSLA